LYRGLFRDLLAKVAKEREKEKESFDRPSETRLVSRARTERERERERERKREDKESAAPFVEARYTTRAFWMMMCARKCPVEMSPRYICVRSRGVVDDERE
jgi:L-lysine 2,3-aminomutase